MSTVYIGLMSGTSLDGIDAVAADFGASPDATRVAVLGHIHVGFDHALRAELLALNSSSTDELHRAALAANALARAYSHAVDALLAGSSVARDSVRAIGCHGQTVRHRPGEFDGVGYTVQLNAPAFLAERSGIDVVADFRSRDVAAGGQGAPLVPAFHRAVFASEGQSVAVLNLGGIANLSCIEGASGRTLGFDCGPANVLLDQWCAELTGRPFDAGGAWAETGSVHELLLQALESEPYFLRPAPKSTGRDLFTRKWLHDRLASVSGNTIDPRDVQATLAQLTARTVADGFRRYATGSRELIVCGGGAKNVDMLARLRRELDPVVVISSGERGLPPEQVEATAFAWLARAFVFRRPGNIATVTGATGPRILGALYPGV